MRSRPHLAIPIALALAWLIVGCGASSTATGPAAAAAEARSTESASSLFERGRAALEHGDSVRAEQYLTLAVDRGYPREKALPLLLEACIGSSRLRAALDHAESYLREHPEHEGLRYLVATIYASLGQGESARLELEQLLDHRPDNPDARYLAGVLASKTDGDEAREHFRKYLDVAPKGRRAAEVRSRLSELAIRESLHERRAVEP
jgi:tetratricopeptide (TPR) repeat protein